jgi:hypothetical protein
MDGIDVIRLDGEDLPIDPLGGLQPAGLVVPDRNRECFGKGRHSADYTVRGAKRHKA